MKKRYSYLIVVFFAFKIMSAQNQQILYDFDQLPQTLLLNPGAEVDYNKHIGIPFLSNVSIQAGGTNADITYNNLISGTDSYIDLLRNVYDLGLGNDDFFTLNQQIEILYAGYRWKDPSYYLSFGMYTEIEGFGLYPEEPMNLFFNGESKIDRYTRFDNLNFIGDFKGVFHVGLSKQINEKLNIGARLKFLSGSLNVSSQENGGNYHLEFPRPNYQHFFSDMNVGINSSGYIDAEGFSLGKSTGDYLQSLFFVDGNLGLGLDLGFTYHASKNITVTASMLDLNYLKYSNEVVIYKIDRDFVLDDDTFFNPTEGDEINYWRDKFDDYYDQEQIPIDTIQTGYNINRLPKLNASVKYKFFKNKRDRHTAFRNVYCDYNEIRDVSTDEVGIHAFTDFFRNTMNWAATAYYLRKVNKYFSAKVTYTYNKYSYKNLGLGISTHIKNFNFYATADNLLALPKLKDSNYQTFQFGMNLIFE